jgi:hypothetical protein
VGGADLGEEEVEALRLLAASGFIVVLLDPRCLDAMVAWDSEQGGDVELTAGWIFSQIVRLLEGYHAASN